MLIIIIIINILNLFLKVNPSNMNVEVIPLTVSNGHYLSSKFKSTFVFTHNPGFNHRLEAISVKLTFYKLNSYRPHLSNQAMKTYR